MFTVIAISGFNPTIIKTGGVQTFYSYGPFKSWAAASRWAVDHLGHLHDDAWHIAQHIEVTK